jgi:hypothetical protein
MGYVSINITGAGSTKAELQNIEHRVENAIGEGVQATGKMGEDIGKGFLGDHMFTGNAYASWMYMTTGKMSALITYIDAGIPHPTSYRNSGYFIALEYGRGGIGGPNKIAQGNSGGYTYPHYDIAPSRPALIVEQTVAILTPLFPEIVQEYIGAVL